MTKFVKEGGDLRGQGFAVEGADAQQTAPNNAREAVSRITLQNIRNVFEKGAIGIEQDSGIASGVLLNSSGVGMLEEHFSPGGLEGHNVLGTITKSEIEGFEGGSDVGIRFAKPGAAGIFSAENGHDVLAGLLDD